jgi:hypothetical protein
VPHVHVHILPRKGGDFENNDEIYDVVSSPSHFVLSNIFSVFIPYLCPLLNGSPYTNEVLKCVTNLKVPRLIYLLVLCAL